MTSESVGTGANPWVCGLCGKTIAAGAGAVEIRAPVARDTHPRDRQVTSIHGRDAPPGGTEPLPWWMRDGQPLRVQVVHRDCNPKGGPCTVRIPAERAATLEQWCAYVLELWPNTWLSRADLHGLLALWFVNRGIAPPSLT